MKAPRSDDGCPDRTATTGGSARPTGRWACGWWGQWRGFFIDIIACYLVSGDVVPPSPPPATKPKVEPMGVVAGASNSRPPFHSSPISSSTFNLGRGMPWWCPPLAPPLATTASIATVVPKPAVKVGL
jgi:hypothetical protein